MAQNEYNLRPRPRPQSHKHESDGNFLESSKGHHVLKLNTARSRVQKSSPSLLPASSHVPSSLSTSSSRQQNVQNSHSKAKSFLIMVRKENIPESMDFALAYRFEKPVVKSGIKLRFFRKDRAPAGTEF